MELAKYIFFPLTFLKVGVIPKEMFLSICGLYWVIFCAVCISNRVLVGFFCLSVIVDYYRKWKGIGTEHQLFLPGTVLGS